MSTYKKRSLSPEIIVIDDSSSDIVLDDDISFVPDDSPNVTISEDEFDTDNFLWTSKLKPISQQNSFFAFNHQLSRKTIPDMLQSYLNLAQKKPVSILVPQKKRVSFAVKRTIQRTEEENGAELELVCEKLRPVTGDQSEKENLHSGQKLQDDTPAEDNNAENLYASNHLQPYEWCKGFKNLRDELSNLHFQPKLPPRKVWIPEMKTFKGSLKFYHYYDQKRSPGTTLPIEEHIRKLGGEIVDRLELANCVLFYPSQIEMKPDSLFFLMTAAAGGRHLLSKDYITQSYDAKKFLNVQAFSGVDHYERSMKVHSSILAAVKMSVSYRNDFENGKDPCMFHQNILFAESEDEYKHVILFLRIAGAFVLPYHSKKLYDNNLVTLVVSKSNFHPIAKCVPIVSPEEIEKILKNSYKKFL